MKFFYRKCLILTLGTNVFSWFQSYLNDRLNSVDPFFRLPSQVNFGVPQGSLLRPVLFWFMLMSFLRSKKAELMNCCRFCHLKAFLTQLVRYSSLSFDFLVCFADDSTLGTSRNCKSELRLISENLFETLILWLDANYLS